MTLLAIILGFLPGLVWLFFYLKEDLHPEPKRMIALVFFMGLVSAFVALVAERFINQNVPQSILQLVAPISIYQGFYLLVLALVEELTKFGAAYFSVHKNPNFDEPVDAMIYMVVAGLGFATLENLGAISGASIPGQTAILSNIFTTTSLRFVGATLLHSLTSGLIGYYWATGIRKFEVKRYIFRGLAFATILHAFFNYLIIDYGNMVYIVLFLVVVGFFVLNDFERLKGKRV
ncbi:MAG: PrsW family glutamic-type intramembrane protease [bacterium]|nr:PrsW family glutamic-type intramembrane protease [bacterium]